VILLSQKPGITSTAIVVGEGIIGLSIALRLSISGLQVVVLEKETGVAKHQTGRNSGVIHAGPYYAPGSLKAQLCSRGNVGIKEFAKEFGIPHITTGKILVATDKTELARLHTIADRAIHNRVPSRLIGPEEIREKEPFARGIGGLFVETTGIIDYSEVSKRLAKLIVARGGNIIFGAKVESIDETGSSVAVGHSHGRETADLLVNAGGLHSDLVARKGGFAPSVRIIPFRGEYFELAPDKKHLVNGLIYPVPDPSLPFLGVHLTKIISGEVHAGPNAVLALAREGYRWGDIRFRELSMTLGFSGFPKLAARNMATGLREIHRSLSKKKFASDLSRLVPGITAKDLVRVESGARAQAVRPDGSLVDDFVFEQRGRQLHVLNAPSPAATACLAIADHIVGDVLAIGTSNSAAWFRNIGDT
jgi:L-2-hydroxyglutarate oxidase